MNPGLIGNVTLGRQTFAAVVFWVAILTWPARGTGEQHTDRNDLDSILAGVPFVMPHVMLPSFPDRVFRVNDFGALPGGQLMNTEAFERAIAACVQARGGSVVVPRGIWLTGPIRLRSKVNLHVERGAVILFSRTFEDYPLVRGPGGKSNRFRCVSPISGSELEDVAITGDGIIDGSGEAWRPIKQEKLTATQWKDLVKSGGVTSADGKIWWPSKESLNGEAYLDGLKGEKNLTADDFRPAREFLRPVMVQLFRCRRVLLDGPTFQNSPQWNIHPIQCDNVVIRNIAVKNPWYAQNGDGLDLGSCSNTVVYRSSFDVGDDAICLKPGATEERESDRPACENIVIADCVVYHGHGGFVIGSESYGGARNVSVRNCTFIGTDVGLRFKSARGKGGVIERVFVDGIVMKAIPHEAILFDMYYGDGNPESHASNLALLDPGEPVTGRTPQFRDIVIRNVSCVGAGRAVLLLGLQEMPLQRIVLDNIMISARKGVLCAYSDGFVMQDFSVLGVQGPVVTLSECRDVLLRNGRVSPGTEVFLNVLGKNTGAINVDGTDLSTVHQPLRLGNGADARSVNIRTK
jgi:polygalacturonase